MRLVADENVDRLLVRELRARGHMVIYAAERDTGLADVLVLDTARGNQAILITEDKGFGEFWSSVAAYHAVASSSCD